MTHLSDDHVPLANLEATPESVRLYRGRVYRPSGYRRGLGELVRECVPFYTNRQSSGRYRVYAEWHTHTHTMLYVVYSYGMHFPMYVYDLRIRAWLRNTDKYSRSTTQHQWAARPGNVAFLDRDTREMCETIRLGGLSACLLKQLTKGGALHPDLGA